MGENPWHRARGGACLERNTQLGNPARYDDSEVHIYRYVWRHSHKGPHRPIPSRTDFQSFLCSQDTSWLTGISVEVFGFFGIFPGFPLEPSNIRSQFSIDDGIPTELVLLQTVSKPFSRQKFYDSGKLSAGNHTLAVTNLGGPLWMDYFQFDDGNGVNVTSGPTSGTSVNVTATSTTQSSSVDATTTTTTTLPSSSTTIITAPWTLSSIKDNAAGWTASSTSEFETSSQFAPFTVTAAFPLSSLAHLSSLVHLSSLSLASSSTLFPNATTLPQGAETPRPQAHRIPRSLLVGIIGCVLIASPILLAILLHVARRYQRRARSRITASRYPFCMSSSPLYSVCAALLTLNSLVVHSDSRGADDDSFFAPESPYSTTSAAIPVAGCPEDIPDGEGAGPCSRGEPCLQPAIRRSKDGGVRVAGGPRELAYSDAPSISDAASEKSTLPPSYREYDCDYP